jgi:hypothetical protein
MTLDDAIYQQIDDISYQFKIDKEGEKYLIGRALESIPPVMERLKNYVYPEEYGSLLDACICYMIQTVPRGDRDAEYIFKQVPPEYYKQQCIYFDQIARRAEQDQRGRNIEREPQRNNYGRLEPQSVNYGRRPETNGGGLARSSKSTSSRESTTTIPDIGFKRSALPQEEDNMFDQTNYTNRSTGAGLNRPAAIVPQKGSSKQISSPEKIFIGMPQVRDKVLDFLLKTQQKPVGNVNEISLQGFQMGKYIEELSQGGVTLYRHCKEEFVSMGTIITNVNVVPIMEQLVKLKVAHNLTEILIIVEELKLLDAEYLVLWLQNRLSTVILEFGERNHNLESPMSVPILTQPEQSCKWLKENGVLESVLQKVVFTVNTLFNDPSYNDIKRIESTDNEYDPPLAISPAFISLRYSVPILLLSNITTWNRSTKTIKIADLNPCVLNDAISPVIGQAFALLNEPYDDELLIMDKALQMYKTYRYSNVDITTLGSFI